MISRRPLATFVAFALAASAFLAQSGSARAVERQHHAGVSGGVAALSIADKSTLSVGVGSGVHYTYGLTDQFNFMAEGFHSVVATDEFLGPDIPLTRPHTVTQGGLGVAYVLDVLRWVPYFGAMGQVMVLGGGTLPSPRTVVGATLAVGLDYQISRHFAAGVFLREHLPLSALSTYPTMTTAGLRLEYLWGW